MSSGISSSTSSVGSPTPRSKALPPLIACSIAFETSATECQSRWRSSGKQERYGLAKVQLLGANGGQCVEVASDDAILVRDTTNRKGGTLTFSAAAWQEFTASVA